MKIGSSVSVAVLVALTGLACTEAVGDNTEELDLESHPIVGGKPADANEWPSTVALYRNSTQICGGTLVAPNWVLTAGHCVSPSSATGGISKVVIGKLKLSQAGGESITVKKAIRHAGYNSSTLANDIALLELTTASTLPPAKIAQSRHLAAIAPEAMTTVVGWGAIREGGPTSDALLEVDVPIIDNAKCKTFPRYNNVNDGMICAGYPNGQKDSCQGDSGGPLYMKINDEVIHVGLTSWGIGCARANAPGVYTRTSTHLEWLKTQTNGAVGTEPTPEPTPDPVPAPVPSEPTPAPTPSPSAD